MSPERSVTYVSGTDRRTLVGERGFEPPTPLLPKKGLGRRAVMFPISAVVLQPSYSSTLPEEVICKPSNGNPHQGLTHSLAQTSALSRYFQERFGIDRQRRCTSRKHRAPICCGGVVQLVRTLACHTGGSGST